MSARSWSAANFPIPSSLVDLALRASAEEKQFQNRGIKRKQAEEVARLAEDEKERQRIALENDEHRKSQLKVLSGKHDDVRLYLHA